MTATASPPSAAAPGTTAAGAQTHAPHNVHKELPRERARGGAPRVLSSMMRIASLQAKIWMTQAKITVMRIALYAALYAGAAVLGILGIIFLYIGLFRVLTDVIGLRPVWAYLIFAVLHIAIAGVLVIVGTKILSKPVDDDEDESPHEKNQEPT